jgi:predicted TIM-barrel fold metal-dependent hydrolase
VNGALDLWVNLVPPGATAQLSGDPSGRGAETLFGEGVTAGSGENELLKVMEETGVGTAVLTAGLSIGTGAEDFLDVADRHPGRFLVAGMVIRAADAEGNAERVRELAKHPRFGMVRVAPLVEQVPLNDQVYYPVYAACEEAGIPVGINVGVPGPPVRSRCQDPVLLEDVLIDFPNLVVIGSHMGHPYEGLLITYMMKWPNLYLSNSAYLAKYMDPALITFMNSSRGIGRVLFGSDHPILPLPKAIGAAKELSLGPEAMDAFLGGAARRLLRPAD